MISCFEERIELDLNANNRKPVVNAWISSLDKPQYVNLSFTTNFLGKPSIEFINNAMVILEVNEASYVLENDGFGNYFLPADWIKVIGGNYRLKIEHEDEVYEAEQVMRSCPLIENARTELVEFDNTDTIDLYESIFDFQETLGEGDGYYFIDFLKDSVDGDSLFNGGYANDEFIDGEYLSDIKITEFDRLYKMGDTLIIELYSIGKETVNYFSDIESEVFSDGPFDAPPANIRTNISNGALGYFIIGDAESVELIVE